LFATKKYGGFVCYEKYGGFVCYEKYGDVCYEIIEGLFATKNYGGVICYENYGGVILQTKIMEGLFATKKSQYKNIKRLNTAKKLYNNMKG